VLLLLTITKCCDESGYPDTHLTTQFVLGFADSWNSERWCWVDMWHCSQMAVRLHCQWKLWIRRREKILIQLMFKPRTISCHHVVVLLLSDAVFYSWCNLQFTAYQAVCHHHHHHHHSALVTSWNIQLLCCVCCSVLSTVHPRCPWPLFPFVLSVISYSTLFTVRLHVVQRTILLSQFCSSVCLSVYLSVRCVLCEKTK